MALGKSEAERRAAEVIRLTGLRKDASKVVSFRLSVHDYERLSDLAPREGFAIATLVKAWTIQRINSDG